MAAGEILFLVHRIPFPPDRGDKIRSHHILHKLRGIGPVHVGCFADDARDMGFADEMAALTASQCVLMRDRSRAVAGVNGLLRRQPMLVAMYESAAMHQWVRQVLRDRPIRAIVGYSVQMAHFVPRDLPEGARFIMDFVDFDSAKYAAYGAGQGGVMGWVNRREGRVLLDFERATARRADVSLFVSEAEAAMFAQAARVPQADIRALDNGVDLEFFSPGGDFAAIDKPGAPLIVFTGQMDYRPNIEAVTSFAREAFPAIRAVHRQATFAIVGRGPASEVTALGALPGVVVTGAVPDVRGWLAAADVVVAPLRIARGIQNKVLEAMAMGRPVVASPQAAEGIDAGDGEHLIIAYGPEDEAQACLRLIAEPDRAAAFGAAARARVEARYAWDATLAPLRDMVTGA
ncbi:MAG: TIGR03087 family PEP-CTERM/XrtA system glycosyltransferase [Sphingobium sp.]|jgi:sugar transferase (PEP-CTERM/EpsH1 system associated)|nr:TIGR03087 family PEP-CTERM/XrtA system glycosyltransferase [Sphingobium sp.]MCI1272111.1 TIGR03087 family PEP-CTERM/XrtA system glycosyltransferase [Sphingobium sp.]MCI1755022.1 TIGR03087 family PEP-CTERM/XrtA system glycosyltransferase [Sphingobium sp.]MCI2051772.1 TIGR03087 family PEP-CTERM/XrtA system glycosyltransferase [Sphingobium sp.]